jgi:hypothetical protein
MHELDHGPKKIQTEFSTDRGPKKIQTEFSTVSNE